MGNKNQIIRHLNEENAKLKEQIKNKSLSSKTLKNSLEDIAFNLNGYNQSSLNSLTPAIRNINYTPVTLNFMALTYMYKSAPLIQTIVDIPVDDAFRGGLDIQIPEYNAEDLKKFGDTLDELNVINRIAQAEKWARLYGGASLVINTNQDPSKPLDYKNIRQLSFFATNRWELTAPKKLDTVEGDIKIDPAPINSDYYYLYGQKIHKSRVVTFSGKEAPFVIRWQYAGWGMSIVERLIQDQNIYIETKNVIYELLSEAKIDVWKLKGFNENAMTDGGAKLVTDRVMLANEIKNTQNATILDSEDDFQQKQLTFNGLSDMSNENRINVCSAFRIPMTKLFGLSATGFNTGEDSIENYNSMIESEVRTPSRSNIRKVLEVVLAYKFKDIPQFEFEFKPLRVLSSVEEENIKTSKQNRVLGMYDRGLITLEQAVDMLKKEKLLSADIEVQKQSLLSKTKETMTEKI